MAQRNPPQLSLGAIRFRLRSASYGGQVALAPHSYTALGAGVAVGAGRRAIQMRNAKGVVLTLEGEQLGLQFDFDLSGMSV
ncbi:hypothetical protein HP556_24245, partial [Tardiphaga robiniae]|nr:hypothetical protein [Tardiphaga robiniae]